MGECPVCGGLLTIEIAYIRDNRADWRDNYTACPACLIQELLGENA